MADLGSKEALKVSINAKIFTNTTFEVSAEDIRSSFEDTIDTLGGSLINVANFGDLQNLVTNNLLQPGAVYTFPYETVHNVEGLSSGNLLNIDTPGYSSRVETLAIVAKDDSSFFEHARSLNYPKDIIIYDYSSQTEPETSTARPGIITYRKNTAKNVEGHFDIRNHIVARYPLNEEDASVEKVAGTPGLSVDKGDIFYWKNEVAHPVASGWFIAALDIADLTTDLADPLKTGDAKSIAIIDQSTYGGAGAVIGGQAIPIKTSGVTYHDSIDDLSENVDAALDSSNIVVVNSKDIKIEGSCSNLTIVNVFESNIGYNVTNSSVYQSTDVKVDYQSAQNHIFSSNHAAIKGSSSNNALLSSAEAELGAGTSGCFLQTADTCKIGSKNSGHLILGSSFYNKTGDNCANFTIVNGQYNEAQNGCSSIQIYGGSYNRFAQGCSSINMLGDRDDELGLGNSYTSPYSRMDYNTFGTGCENISFEGVGGRGNQFGDECANLQFTDPANRQWRLVGCYFVRGIRNKTFQYMIHSASFLVPNQVTATIDATRWYSPVLYVGTFNEAQRVNNNESSGARAFGEGTIGPDNYNRIAMGYERVNPSDFFRQGAQSFTGGVSHSESSGGEESLVAQDFQIHGYATYHAFMWNHEGYPLSMTITPGLQNLVADPTGEFNQTP